MGMRNVNAKHTEYEVRGAKAVNNRIETESEENDYGTDKKEWSEINEGWRLYVWQMEGKSTARI